MQKIVRKRIHYACVMALIVVTCVVQGCEKKVEKKVFSVTADAKISNDEGNKRLQIIVDIDNISDEDYKNVTYIIQEAHISVNSYSSHEPFHSSESFFHPDLSHIFLHII